MCVYMCTELEGDSHISVLAELITWSYMAETVFKEFLSLMLLLLWFVFLTSRDLPASPLFDTSK